MLGAVWAGRHGQHGTAQAGRAGRHEQTRHGCEGPGSRGERGEGLLETSAIDYEGHWRYFQHLFWVGIANLSDNSMRKGWPVAEGEGPHPLASEKRKRNI
jgi:hypothetical protein